MTIEDANVLPPNSDKPDSGDLSVSSPVKYAMEQLELLALRKNSSSGLDLDSLSESQKDKVLEIMSKNEDNGFQYHMKKLDVDKEVRIKIIDSTTSGHRTTRILFIAALLVLAIVTVLILFYQDKYFTTWISFLMGLAGGFGISKISPQSSLKNTLNKTPKSTEKED